MSVKKRIRRKTVSDRRSASATPTCCCIDEDDKDNGQRTLIVNLRRKRKSLEKLLEKVSDHWGLEDIVYRLYHQSYKVQFAMDLTRRILEELEGLYKNRWKHRNTLFKKIMEEGLDIRQDPRKWIEALLHAKYFLEMAVKYSREVKKPLQVLPSGYASLLYLYGLR